MASLTLLPGLLVDEGAYRDPSTDLLDRPAVETAKNELSRTLLQGVAALGLGTTAVITWWRIRLSEFEAGTGAQGQVAERLSRSLEHLASKSTVVRIGGIYSLERIAQQSDFDRVPIVRILSGFATERSRDMTAAGDVQASGDVEAALLAISRLRFDGSPADRLNLGGVHAPGSDLSWSLSLEGANLANANLAAAQLSGAWLPFAELRRSILDEAQMPNVEMPNCSLEEAQARGIRVMDSDMRRLRAGNADLSNAMFGDVILYDATFENTTLSGTRFLGCDLSGAQFAGASMHDTSIGNCWLTGTDFSDTDLLGVTWTTADGTLNEWDPANPPRWPPGFDPPERGTKFWGTGPKRDED